MNNNQNIQTYVCVQVKHVNVVSVIINYASFVTGGLCVCKFCQFRKENIFLLPWANKINFFFLWTREIGSLTFSIGEEINSADFNRRFWINFSIEMMHHSFSQLVALNKFISIKPPFAKLLPFPRVFAPLSPYNTQCQSANKCAQTLCWNRYNILHCHCQDVWYILSKYNGDIASL